jgi:tRNA-binding protein
MFIGHFAVGFAAKRALPHASLAALFAGAQLAEPDRTAAIGSRVIRIVDRCKRRHPALELVGGSAPRTACALVVITMSIVMPSFIPAPVKPPIPISVLDAIDVRLGTIQSVGDVAGSTKLVKLTVTFGDHARQILAGMKRERADLTALVGRQALFVVNVEPKRMAGELSEGMLFDIGFADGLPPALAVPERLLPDGARAG